MNPQTPAIIGATLFFFAGSACVVFSNGIGIAFCRLVKFMGIVAMAMTEMMLPPWW